MLPAVRVTSALAIAAALLLPAAAAAPEPFPLDRAGERWVEQTLKTMTADEKIGQLIIPSFESSFLSTDSDTFDHLATLVRDYHVGGFHVFGASEAAPPVLLNPTYGTTTLGSPLAAASILNRLQALSRVPLMNSADFETGPGFRLAGATTFPRQMAFGAAGDVAARARGGAHHGGRGARDRRAGELRARRRRERQPAQPGHQHALVRPGSGARRPRSSSAYVAGARDGGMIATLKHFPGHGDTDTDTHLGLAVVAHDRDELDKVELVPFRLGIAGGAQAVMTSHIELPAIDAAPATPATFSSKIVDGLLRGDLGFGGLVYTDSMSMEAVTKLVAPGEGAVRADPRRFRRSAATRPIRSRRSPR